MDTIQVKDITIHDNIIESLNEEEDLVIRAQSTQNVEVQNMTATGTVRLGRNAGDTIHLQGTIENRTKS